MWHDQMNKAVGLMDKRCPRCGSILLEGVEVCECGHELTPAPPLDRDLSSLPSPSNYVDPGALARRYVWIRFWVVLLRVLSILLAILFTWIAYKQGVLLAAIKLPVRSQLSVVFLVLAQGFLVFAFLRLLAELLVYLLDHRQVARMQLEALQRLGERR